MTVAVAFVAHLSEKLSHKCGSVARMSHKSVAAGPGAPGGAR